MQARALAGLARQTLPDVPAFACQSLDQALDAGLALPQGLVVCGSLYLAAQARPALLRRIGETAPTS